MQRRFTNHDDTAGAEPAQDSNLFSGAAHFYARFRPAYPITLKDDLASMYRLNGQGTLLDLGAGTSELTLLLAKYFDACVAVEPDPSMQAEGQRKCAAAAASPVRWVLSRAEEFLAHTTQSFRLTVIGRAFHWMNRDEVLSGLWNKTEPDGGVVIVSDGSLWTSSDAAFQQTIREVVQRYGTIDERSTERHEQVIARSPFAVVDTLEYVERRTWSFDQIVGYCFSTSACAGLNEQDRAGFTSELFDRLGRPGPTSAFDEIARIEAICLRAT